MMVQDYSQCRLKWFDAVKKGDLDTMQKLLHQVGRGLSPLRKVQGWIAPMVEDLGRWWQLGEVSVTQEHIASSVLESYLAAQRMHFHAPEGAPALLFCTLPMEQHTLGLQMAALVAAEAQCKVIYAGRRIPRAEIALAARHYKVRGVCLSFSACSQPRRVCEELEILAQDLGSEIQIWGGGSGMPTNLPMCERVTDFTDFYQRLTDL